MNENKGFILKQEMYHKKEWCKMYHMVIKEYRILQRRIEKANTLLDGLLERAYIDGEYIMYDYSTSELLEVKQALE